MGDKICVFKDGVIQQVDTPLNLYNCPKNLFVAGFIGSPAMNLVPGRFENADTMQFNINVVEPMGNEVFVYGSCGQRDLCMRTTSVRIYRPNEVMRVGFDLDRVHFFDSQMQERIT